MRNTVARELRRMALNLGWTRRQYRRLKRQWNTIPRPRRGRAFLEVQAANERSEAKRAAKAAEAQA